MPGQRASVPPANDNRRSRKPIVCYEVDGLPQYDADFYQHLKQDLVKIEELVVPPRDGRSFKVPAGHFFRTGLLFRPGGRSRRPYRVSGGERKQRLPAEGSTTTCSAIVDEFELLVTT